MIKIAHRGNMFGPQPEHENSEHAINASIRAGFDVEIDIWKFDDLLFLGHDLDNLAICNLETLDFLIKHKKNLWIHCKNLNSLKFFFSLKHENFNFFFHNTDDYTLTSHGFIWSHGSNNPVDGVIINSNKNDILPQNILGVCSDYIALPLTYA